MSNSFGNIDNIPSRDLPKKPGVYLLHDKKTGWIYVGGTKNIRSRISVHRSLLHRKKHTNNQLQKAYDKGELFVYVLVVLPSTETKTRIEEIEGYFIKAIPTLFAIDSINLRCND
ncbi:GIY-YIG nuclease family protein [Neobacillus cucumis]|uniref:GIY-YIG nuclease family protein n=1 Tax=Neobacillus cucumis TaxID=1740721 RepID=UPI002E1F208B|nr:GIY-YIG nuclease family protein [Neobacillus cucumis]